MVDAGSAGTKPVDRAPELTAPPAAPPRITQPIVFFDGVCGLCNRFVDRILRADRHGRLRFATLQGVTAREMLPTPPDDPREWTVIYVDERGRHERSDAVIEIWRRVGGWRRAAVLLRVVPRVLRDQVYRVIARNRYRWFGKRDACRIPSPAERARFLA